MPCDLFGRFSVQAQEEAGSAPESEALIFPHHASHIVTAAEFIAEAAAVHVQEHTTHSTQSFCCQNFDLFIWLIGMHQSGGMDLDPFKIHELTAHSVSHLEAITSAMLTIGCWQMCKVKRVLYQQ